MRQRAIYSDASASPCDATTELGQVHLIPGGRSPIYLIVGPTCAGKSTIGMYAQEHTGYQAVEASAIVRAKRDERGQEDVAIGEFARRLLAEEGAAVVARTIADSYCTPARNRTLVITGFRSVEEIQFFRESYRNVCVVSIEAPSRVRYDRYIRRGGRSPIESYAAFRRHDAEEYGFGLLQVASMLADKRLKNVFTPETYYRQAARLFGIGSDDVPGSAAARSRIDPETSQLYHCLVAMMKADRPLSTQELESRFDLGGRVCCSNSNRVLRRYLALAQREVNESGDVNYQITQSGLAFLAAVDWLQA